ncbi:GntR family transcriptional regulator [Brenneria populi subsp. brevivirga]|uniref:GntR family transcriptional regulator n=1 Tax=Brenneria populi TaxID=1505588 RepID=UPI002E183165|nr:GntR family transcriptional regulator [Brenneria populi subsp. brevivirga]
MQDDEQTDVERVCNAIYQAIFERRLEPNTRLVETKLAAALDTSRPVIRQALLLMAQRKLVEIKPNKGAEVAEPTEEQAREVFQARRLIEKEIVSLACRTIREADLRQLRRHLDTENHARAIRDRYALIRATGEFHIVLAEIAGNQFYLDFLRQLIALSSLILEKCQSDQSHHCDESHHAQLVDLIANGESEKAQQLMLTHLDEIEAELVFERPIKETDLEAVFHAVRKPL